MTVNLRPLQCTRLFIYLITLLDSVGFRIFLATAPQIESITQSPFVAVVAVVYFPTIEYVDCTRGHIFDRRTLNFNGITVCYGSLSLIVFPSRV